MKFGIYSRGLDEQKMPYVNEVINSLIQHDAEIFAHQAFFDSFQDSVPKGSIKGTFKDFDGISKLNLDFFITLGGDGTILDAPLLLRNSNIPVVGVNLGRLGFLATIEKEQILEAIEALHNNDFTIHDRTLLELKSDPQLFEGSQYALNDFALSKRDTSSMIIIHTYMNGSFLNSYWADGLIVATPTGSTGYSLSCGGPIVFPNSGNFVITPVAPHSLTIRPLVIDDDVELSFEIEGRAKNYLCTLDSRFETLGAGHRLTIKKAPFILKLVRLKGSSFLSTIRSKLTWGKDHRN